MADSPHEDSPPGLSVDPEVDIDWDAEAQRLLDPDDAVLPPAPPKVPGQAATPPADQVLGPFVLTLQALAEVRADFSGRFLPDRGLATGGKANPDAPEPDEPVWASDAPMPPAVDTSTSARSDEPAVEDGPKKSAIDASLDEDDDDVEPWVFTFEGQTPKADEPAKPTRIGDADEAVARIMRRAKPKGIGLDLSDGSEGAAARDDAMRSLADLDADEAVAAALADDAPELAAPQAPEAPAFAGEWSPPMSTEDAIAQVVAQTHFDDPDGGHDDVVGSLSELADLAASPAQAPDADAGDLDDIGDLDLDLDDEGDDGDGGVRGGPDGDDDPDGNGGAPDTRAYDDSARFEALAELRDLGL